MAVYRLRILQGTGVGTEYPLDGSEMTLGRSPENFIHLQDNNCSRVHARILVVGGKAILQDNRSRNGIYVNNERVQEHTLTPGDRIGIGSTIFEFLADAAPRPAVQQVGQPRASGQQPRGPQRPRRGAVQGPQRTLPPKQGSNRLMLYGIGGLAIVAIAGMMIYNRMNQGNVVLEGPQGRTTLQPLPEITRSTSFNETQQKARALLDHGDSKVVSGDLTGAYLLYTMAVKVDGNCDICKKRKDTCKTAIMARVTEYERGGEIAYANGRFREAAERWTAAKELLGGFNKGKTKELDKLIAEADREAKRYEP